MSLANILSKIELRAVSRPVVLVIGVLLIGLIGAIDYAIGTEIGFSIFYLIPVLFVTWNAGSWWGLVVAAACTFLWLINDAWLGGHHYSHQMIPVWNALIRGGYFTIICILADHAKGALAQQAAASRSKTDLLAMVSHELGNHLAVLGMSVKLLQEESLQDPARQKELYAMIERTLGILNHSVLNFLNYARAENGKLDLNIRRTEFRTLVEQAFDAMALLIKQKNIQVHRDFPPRIIPLAADPEAMVLVLANLIGNAVKYTPQGGSVTIRLIPNPPTMPNKVVVSIEDTGIGISADDLRNILTMFHRTQSGKKFAKGFGVGLRVVKDILDSHGTQLEIASTPGRGSRFFFSLPILRES